MNRLQKKCLASSAVLHGLLAVIVLLAPGFLSKRRPESPPALTFIPRTVLDSALSGGGSPTGAPPPPAAKIEQPVPTPPPPPQQPVAKVEPAPVPTPKPPPEPPKPVVKDPILPVPPVKKTVTKPVIVEPPPKAQKQTTKTAPQKSPFDFTKAKTKPSDVKRETDKKKAVATEQHDAAEAAAAQARAKALAGLKSSVNSLKNNLSSPISAEPLGPGGEAFANYGQIVVSIYQNAWAIPDDVNDDSAVVQATVTIARDGTVVSARLLQRSGRSLVDKSVQRTLDAVKFIQKFPEGARDAQRTFNINFNLKAKRQLG
ncbi:MAG: TonB family protein [Verrucomicrobia bacterium]|nr:TonB family protein [Verrucomicrobiota bacterium]